MAELSRTKKYKDLRNTLQNDTGTDSFSTKELSRFEKRLNQIDATNFSAPKETKDEDYSGSHARSTLARVTSAQPAEIIEEGDDSIFDTGSFRRNENFTPTFDNDYLDQYIREVKEYNIAQGNAVSENTTVNVLHNLRSGNAQSSSPSTPYPTNFSSDPVEKQAPYSFNTPNVSSSFENTADLPFVTPAKVSNSSQTYEDSYDTQSKTKEDIMAEVQNLVNGKMASSSKNAPRTKETLENTASNTFEADTFARSSYDAERTTRQQLLNETTQMRAQLDDYEDNLSEVTDKMRRTNHILNIVLIVLIVALVVILGIVIYIVTLAK